MRLLCLAAVFADDYSGHGSRGTSMNGPNHFIGSPPQWGSASTSVSDAWLNHSLFMGGGTKKDTHVTTAKGFALYSGTIPAWYSFPKYGVVQVDCPGSDIQARSFPDVGVEESVRPMP